MRGGYELKRLERTKKYLQALIDDNAPQADINDAQAQVDRWQKEYDYKSNKLFDNVEDDEEQRIIDKFNSSMDKIVNEQGLMVYNSALNDYQHVYEVLKFNADMCLIPNSPEDRKDLEDYNIAFDSIPELLSRYIKSRYNNITGLN